jgi:hypothetical protein
LEYILKIRWLIFPALFFSTQLSAVTLDEIFVGIKTCSFKEFQFVPDDAHQTHPYLVGREPTPASDKFQYYFKVYDALFGLPVVEVSVPGTWVFHSVTFDVPLDKAREVLRKKFGTHFPNSKQSLAGKVPALEASASNPNQSVLYCAERDEE